MTFQVTPDALRQYAAALADASSVAEETQRYANTWGTFTPHESGILGKLINSHEPFVADLNETFSKLARVLDTSAANMRSVAATYEQTDEKSAAAVDASYPPVQRPITSAGS